MDENSVKNKNLTKEKITISKRKFFGGIFPVGSVPRT